MANEKRLIDANALKEQISNAFEEHHCNDCPYRLDGSCTKEDPVCSTIDDLRDFPTVDAVEVVHGRWIFGTANHREHMKCSECLHSYTPDGTFGYCPNCGAKMDGDPGV